MRHLESLPTTMAACLLAGWVWLIGANASFAQSGRFGAHVGIPIVNEHLAEGWTYLPWQLLFTCELHHFHPGDRRGLVVLAEPQLIWAHFSPKRKTSWEAGVNLVAEYRIPAGQRHAVHLAVGAGPHYLASDFQQQASGFIFSDNFTAGWHFQSAPHRPAFDLKLRFRHISNAGLQEPNLGIDTWFLILGISGWSL